MSKRIWQHPDVPAGETTISWRSVGQLEDTPSFRKWLEREFPQGAAQMEDEADVETSRRAFLKLMGASTALAGFGLASCRRPEKYIVPYTKAPEWVIPGKATYYASSMPRAKGAAPLVVTTFEGRPTKVAVNSLHPGECGADAFVQASVLDLYSPNRSRTFLKGGAAASREEFEKVLATLAADGSAKLAVVYGRDDSPTRARLTKALAEKFKEARFYAYEALEGNTAEVLGSDTRLQADYSKADRLVALDCDFLSLDSHGPSKPFFDRRKPEGVAYDQKPNKNLLNRLYAVETSLSMTGGMADHRLRVAPSQVLKIAGQIAFELGIENPVERVSDEKTLSWIRPLVEDLKSHAGKSLVLAGSRQSAALQYLALAINQKLGNVGEGKPLRMVSIDQQGLGDLKKLCADLAEGAVDTVLLLTPSNPVFDAPADLKFSEALAKAKLSLHFGLRTDATALASTWHVPAAHYLESWGDTRTGGGVYSVVQPMILPLYPDCVGELELLAALLSDDGALITGEGPEGQPTPAYEAVRKTFEGLGGKGKAAWTKFLHLGFHEGSSYDEATVEAELTSAGATKAFADAKALEQGGLEVIFATDGSLWDGRWIDNAWLQEAPDPITKLTWDNAALISPQTAKELGVYEEVLPLETKTAAIHPDGEGEHRKARMIRIKVNGGEIVMPVLITFGQADGTIVLPVGYGQGYDDEDELGRLPKNSGAVGHVGVNTGFNVYPLRTSQASYFVGGASVEKVNQRYPLALTQEHFSMYGRALAREISTMTDEKSHKSFEEQAATVAKQGNDAHAPVNVSLYKQEDRDGKSLLSDPLHQWGMTIDLSSCMGCNACLISCQAENNIPVVGKEQVARGREMHWVRMDRYFAIDQENDFDPGNPAVVPQPVSCVQCESAPCETVCPVNATVHTEDGLNAMAYNRCIGTRYCANNCPYKARRFNFFDYNKRNPLIPNNLYYGPFGKTQVGEAPHLQRNPNVTVRMRGVMEKCTYCVQRLKDAKIRQKRGQKQEVLLAGKASPEVPVSTETLRIPVDSLKVACQEACSAGAIQFGNLLDGDRSTMVRAKASGRNYDLLHYIGTKPRTSYLARVKNPNDKMPDAKFIGRATIHMH